jgi:hypothetical protein
MAGIAILQGPQAPADAPLGFCTLCLAVGKFQALAEIRQAIEAHERTGQGTKRWVLAVPKEYLQRAVAWSMVPALGMAAPVCWTHVIALQPLSGGIVPAQGMPPGLNGGQGIPLLGQ